MSSSPRQLRPVKVQVAGQMLALRSDASATYLRELAAFVDAKLAEVRDQHFAAPTAGGTRRPVSTQALALLCALQLADELRQTENRASAQRDQIRERTERILRHLELLDPATPSAPTGRGRRKRTADRIVSPEEPARGVSPKEPARGVSPEAPARGVTSWR